jgi:hypothetical protein
VITLAVLVCVSVAIGVAVGRWSRHIDATLSWHDGYAARAREDGFRVPVGEEWR